MGSEYLKHMDSVNETELRLLMDRYGDDVWKYAYVITRDREQARDIAQEVFIKAHYGIRSFRGQSSIKTWLLAITRNLSLNYVSSGYFRKILLFGIVKSRQAVPSAESAYMGERTAGEIWEVILCLPNKLHEVLVLDLEHELPVREIAQLLGLPEGTVKSRLHRARKSVESTMKGWEQ
ncbi:sigma-70 family RNA polymerase sigma factor [Cohnella endophytica]|uniref:Sigma-70 family RNA polymerase sigma factor n=2 Tax=Cohnella endophytica TaxID=2419778 RepID=A0A494XYI2_9BACL|nr:sigma-70 family RNA polymerase sigma factor [Cohnella endophytica]